VSEAAIKNDGLQCGVIGREGLSKAKSLNWTGFDRTFPKSSCRKQQLRTMGFNAA
jgi:hypothetical protein